jgi:transposase-like protein
VLEVLVQSRRDKRAAKKFLKKLLKGLSYQPRVIITDKLASYAAARRELLPSVEHHRGGRLNNQAEISHQPTRERERKMRGLKSIDAPCATIAFGPRYHRESLSACSASFAGPQLPSVDAAEIHDVASRHWPTGVDDFLRHNAVTSMVVA